MTPPHPDDAALVEAANAVRDYFTGRTGFAVLDEDGHVSACYGGHWITLDPTEIASAALAALRQHEADKLKAAQKVNYELQRGMCEIVDDNKALRGKLEKAREAYTGYVDAFYELAMMLNVGARNSTPEHVWRTEILPKLQALIGAKP